VLPVGEEQPISGSNEITQAQTHERERD